MKIPYQKYTLSITAKEELHLPYYKGSTFRGGFGNMFRRIVCALRRQDCSDCILKSRCIYAYVFETPPPENATLMNMHKYEKIPHPFVIEPPEGNDRRYGPESIVSFNLILIGRAIDYLPYFIYTFDELGNNGIGKGRGRYRLQEVRLEDNRLVYSGDNKLIRRAETSFIEIHDFIPSDNIDSITLRFITPLRIKYNRDLVVKPEFHVLIRNLLRRLGLLYYFHCGNQEPSWNHKEIINHAQKVSIASSAFKWLDWERYSSRQDIRMRLGGLIGEITYIGNIEPFMPLLKAGETMHIGKGTSFGLGKFVLHHE